MKTKFIIAEETRQEADGKHSVRGLFSDDTILVTLPAGYAIANNPPPGLDILTCLLSVRDLPPGKHKIFGRLVDPAGKQNAETPKIDFDIAQGQSRAFPFTLTPFIMTGGAGFYTWTFTVDETDVTHSFEVRITESSN